MGIHYQYFKIAKSISDRNNSSRNIKQLYLTFEGLIYCLYNSIVLNVDQGKIMKVKAN